MTENAIIQVNTSPFAGIMQGGEEAVVDPLFAMLLAGMMGSPIASAAVPGAPAPGTDGLADALASASPAAGGVAVGREPSPFADLPTGAMMEPSLPAAGQETAGTGQSVSSGAVLDTLWDDLSEAGDPNGGFRSKLLRTTTLVPPGNPLVQVQGGEGAGEVASSLRPDVAGGNQAVSSTPVHADPVDGSGATIAAMEGDPGEGIAASAQPATSRTVQPAPAAALPLDGTSQSAQAIAGADGVPSQTRNAPASMSGVEDIAEPRLPSRLSPTVADGGDDPAIGSGEATILRAAGLQQGERPANGRGRGETTDIASTRSERMAAAQALPAGSSVRPVSSPISSTETTASSFVPEAPAARSRWMREVLQFADDVPGTQATTASDPAAELFEMEFGELRALRESGSMQVERAYARMQTQAPPAVQVVQQLNAAAQLGVERLQIQLHPEELGSLDIELVFDRERKVSVSISVERPETLELLQRETRQIERLLTQNGLQLDQGLDLAMYRERPDGGGAQGRYSQNREGFGGYLEETAGDQPVAPDSPVPQTWSLRGRGFYDLTI